MRMDVLWARLVASIQVQNQILEAPAESCKKRKRFSRAATAIVKSGMVNTHMQLFFQFILA